MQPVLGAGKKRASVMPCACPLPHDDDVVSQLAWQITCSESLGECSIGVITSQMTYATHRNPKCTAVKLPVGGL
jgi:hypothetical protein